MARTLSAIYTEIQQKRIEYLQLTTYENSSRMSIMNAIMYIIATAIWSLENLMDVFKVDIAKVINNRINGTMAYYINALKNYQDGDELVVADDGCSFSYATVDPSKRIITSAICEVTNENGFYDRHIHMKVATGNDGAFTRLTDAQLINVRNYMQQIVFAGTNISVYSLKGDVLVPKILVCYDGNVTVDALRESIISAMHGYLATTAFTGRFYPSKLVNSIGDVEHVVDVIADGYYNEDQLGVFIAQYDDDDNLVTDDEGNILVKYVNGMDLASGFLREKDSSDTQAAFQAWADAIIIITEEDLVNYTQESVMLTLNGSRISELPALTINGKTQTPRMY
jgi:hypothetical protein